MREPEVPPPSRRVVAVFDFDGTLTKRDTLRLFFIELCGWRGLGRAVLGELPSVLAGGVLGNQHRDRAKAALTRRLLSGRRQEQALAAARRVADRVFDLELLREDTHAWLRWHQSQDHEILIISASFAACVELVGRRLGTNAVLATRWEIDGGDQLTGALVGRNVRGQEKVAQLRNYLQDDDAYVYAYGDSAGDRGLLSTADLGRRVRRYRRLPIPPEPPPYS